MRLLPWLAALVVPILLVRAGVAVPLDPDTCSKLKEEQAELVRKGAKANLARGPEWGKANLTQTGIDDVRRLIEVEEQVQFRCFVPEPEPPKAAAPKKAKAKTATSATEQTPSTSKKAPKAAAKGATDGASKQAPAAKAPVDKSPKTATDKAPQKQAKPKSKPNDAYVPPAK